MDRTSTVMSYNNHRRPHKSPSPLDIVRPSSLTTLSRFGAELPLLEEGTVLAVGDDALLREPLPPPEPLFVLFLRALVVEAPLPSLPPGAFRFLRPGVE